MFFTAYIGGEGGEREWSAAVRNHASMLHKRPVLESRTLPSTYRVALAWLGDRSMTPEVPLRDTGQFLLMRPWGRLTAEELGWPGDQLPAWLGRDWRESAVRMLVDLADESLTISVPPATPEQVCWGRVADGYAVANDVRLFTRLGGAEIDDRAVYALFQYGIIPAPLTIFRSVSRVPGGTRFTLHHLAGESSVRPLLPPEALRAPALGNPDAVPWVGEALDRVLAPLPERPLLLFSGGVDSALLASRLVSLGRRDVQLINYSFGPEDQESRLAMQMAARLGLRCTRVAPPPQSLTDVLGRIGEDYSCPFGDLSTVPTNLLVHEALTIADAEAAIIEGTGADGAFGLAARYPAWRRGYAVPSGMRRAAAALVRKSRIWSRDSRPTRFASFLARSAALPFEATVIAQNALEGVAYATPRCLREELAQWVTDPARRLSAQPGEPALSMVDLTMVCAGAMAQKSFDPLRKRGFTPVYPYLVPEMVYGASALPAHVKCEGGISKSPLKSLIPRDVPPEWIYRAKSGFTPPYRAMFASGPLQEYLRGVALDLDNPLLDFCEVGVVRNMVERASRAEPLSPGVNDFLWTLAFASGWLAGQRCWYPREQPLPTYI